MTQEATKPTTNEKRRPLLLYACVLALGALWLMSWSLFDPRPIPVVLAMSAGQVLGTGSLAMFLWVVIQDVRRKT